MEDKTKNLQDLNDYIAIGFDIDHCLIKYQIKNLFPVIYQAFTKYLIEKYDYPLCLASFTKDDVAFIHNSLIIDLVFISFLIQINRS